MRSIRPILLALAFAILSPAAKAFTLSEEIDHLIDVIATSPCAFIRNGVTYGGEQAAGHVKDKYEYFRDRIHSTEDFIALAATRSELTGRPYLVQCGTTTMPAADWLRRELANLRQHS
jgi:uncharacterized protein DUF5329